MGMKIGASVTACVAVFAMTGVVMAFLNNASPYVTVAEAKVTSGSRLHLAGTIDKKTVNDDRLGGKLAFDLIDKKGDRIRVEHVGEPVANMGDATEVVAIGKVENGTFVSQKMLVKCPTKYEKDRQTPAATPGGTSNGAY